MPKECDTVGFLSEPKSTFFPKSVVEIDSSPQSLDGAIIAPAVVFLIAAGFSTETAVVITVLQILVGLFLHANVRWRLRPMHKIIITPEFHHWHHTNEPDAIWSNYSTFLIVRHPIRAIRAGLRNTRRLIVQIWKSTSRPRGHTPFREISADSATELADISADSVERTL